MTRHQNFFASSLYFIFRGNQWWLFSQARINFVRASYVTTVKILSHIFRWRNVNCSSDLRACVADVIYSRLVTDTMNYRKCVSNFPSSWLAFLTDQSWRVLKSWYTCGGQEKGFRRCVADRLNQKFSSVCGTSTDFITSNSRLRQ